METILDILQAQHLMDSEVTSLLASSFDPALADIYGKYGWNGKSFTGPVDRVAMCGEVLKILTGPKFTYVPHPFYRD